MKKCNGKSAALATEQKRDTTSYTQIPQIYYPWIKGPSNRNIDAILAAQNHGVQVKFPEMGNNVLISGSKEGVQTVNKQIAEIFDTKRGKFKELCFQFKKAEHPKIGLIVDYILKENDVSVEVIFLETIPHYAN